MVIGEVGICPITATLPTKEYILGVTIQYLEVVLNGSTSIPGSMLDKVLIALGEVDIGLVKALLRPIIQVVIV